MIVNRPSGIADLVEAIQTLRAADDATRAVIAGMLGFRWPAAEGSIPRRSSKSLAAVTDDAETPDAAGAPQVQHDVDSRPGAAQARLDAEILRIDPPRSAAPSWLATAKPLRATEARHLRPTLTLDPLFDPKTARAIVSGALATPSLAGGLDVGQVLDQICRANPITRLPLTPVPTLVRGVQVLVDRSEGMQPFAVDQGVLGARIQEVVGRDRTTVLHFSGSPEWNAGTGAPDDWPPYKAPAAGTPVLALTDLGIAAPPGSAGGAGVADWSAFAARLARAGCPLIAFVPYPSSRWPAALRNRMTIVQWDRATTASAVRQAVGIGLQAMQELR